MDGFLPLADATPTITGITGLDPATIIPIIAAFIVAPLLAVAGVKLGLALFRAVVKKFSSAPQGL